MSIRNTSIKRVEDIPTNHGAQRHEPPILRHAAYAKRLSYEGRIAAEQEAVGEAGGGGDEGEVVRSCDLGCEGLGEDEEGGGGDEAPEAGEVQFVGDEVGADACGVLAGGMVLGMVRWEGERGGRRTAD